ncbi:MULTISPECIES: GxxExxY protein [Pedobacter]|uniref:GxxExxY protein n=1 Tax=Pedobacter alluvionis TaxID=475253 RepID=A0A497XYL8_9SPHI|nr:MULTISPECIES: GxxExxY protein [Pedobacter]QXU41610.1 GxxExxY protein [Pedobacter sp. D749]RLJ73827.1 GxxExxY protein [Pedobacter alluvionis]TFB32561.1 GxxExxY protein [Pedobacter alluvionis]
MDENDISYQIRSAIFTVYNALGPGLLESVYETVLTYVLTKNGLDVKQQVKLPVVFEGITLDAGYRIDLLINDLVIIEVKSVETLAPVHHKQVLTYLKLSGLRLGLLVNFNSSDISQSIWRKVNGLF